ncbi:MAG: hypothetical protein WCR02_07840 [Sphaerochaetaceae bacterium]
MDGAKLKELLNDQIFLKKLMSHRGQTKSMQKMFRARGEDLTMVEAEMIDKTISRDLPEGVDFNAYAAAAVKAVPDILKQFNL